MVVGKWYGGYEVVKPMNSLGRLFVLNGWNGEGYFKCFEVEEIGGTYEALESNEYYFIKEVYEYIGYDEDGEPIKVSYGWEVHL